MSDIIRSGPGDSVEVDVQVVPRSSAEKVGERHGDRLKLHVTAPPVDGEANAALTRLVAKAIGVAKREVEIVRGATGRKKTLRISGTTVDAVRKALGLAALMLVAGCSDPRELPITLLFPEDTSDLDAANNASLTLDPGGLVLQQQVDGTDFSLAVELTPDTTFRTLSVFLAQDTELLAWGSSAPFYTAGPDIDLAVFLGRPGRLSTFPRIIENPDEGLLAARAIGNGMMLLGSDGDSFVLNEYTLELLPRAKLSDGPPPDDGGLFSGADGRVVRVAWNEGLAVWEYDREVDSWSELDVDPGAARAGAAALWLGTEVPTGFDEREGPALALFGGGDETDVVVLDLAPGKVTTLTLDTPLDSPRPGATAVLAQSEGDHEVILFGGNEAGEAVGRRVADETSFGPTDAWSSAGCIPLSTGEPARIVCAGGFRDGSETGDGVRVDLDTPVESAELMGLLPVPMREPLWFGDESAVYAQGAGRLVRLARDDLTAEMVEGTALRDRGGHSVTLVTGATFLTGGVTSDGEPLTRWQVFMPAIEQ